MKKTILYLLAVLVLNISYTQNLPIQDTSKVVQVSKKLLKSYEGHYKLNDMALRIQIFLEDNQLFADVAGMGKLRLIAGSDNAFQIKEIQSQLEFLSEKGNVEKIRLYQGGEVIEGSRTDPPVELDYELVPVGDNRIDYSKVIAPYTAEWDLTINGRKVGTATTGIRHAIYKGLPAYQGGSIIRYESMGNKPFADEGIFSKVDYRLLWARNAVSQTDEITSISDGTSFIRYTIDINSGEIKEQKRVDFEQAVNGSDLQSLLAMGIKLGMTVQFPVSGIEKVGWSKVHVKGKEQIQVSALDQTFDAWKLEYSSGTERWIIEEPPYLLKWKMPTGMIWELKSFTN